MNRETFEIPDPAVKMGENVRTTYIEALRDWVKNGAKSQFALTPAEVKRRLRGPSEDELRAANHARLGTWLVPMPTIDPEVALATAALSIEGLEPSRKLLNILGFRPPRWACSGVKP